MTFSPGISNRFQYRGRNKECPAKMYLPGANQKTLSQTGKHAKGGFYSSPLCRKRSEANIAENTATADASQDGAEPPLHGARSWSTREERVLPNRVLQLANLTRLLRDHKRRGTETAQDGLLRPAIQFIM
jgi:hypothetical protein